MKHRLLSWQFALLLVISIIVVSGYVARDLRLNNAPQVYYAPNSPAVVLREKLRAQFPTDETMVVVFEGSDLYAVDFMQRLDKLVKRLEAMPLVDRVSTVTSVERVSGSADGFSVAPLVDVSDLDGKTSAQIRQAVLSDRFAPGTLAARDGGLLAMVVRPKSLDASDQRLALKISVMESVSAEGLLSHYAGDAGQVTLDVAQLQSVMNDSLMFVPLTVGIGLLLLWWVVGRWRPMVIGAMAMLAVVMPTVAVIAATGQPYTMVTAILPSLLSAYTIATLLHFYAAVQRGHAMHMSRGRSIDNALAEGLKPGMFNVATTSAGLLSLIFVPIPPVQVFGTAGALGTALVFVVVYLLVPPFLRHWDNRRWPNEESGLGRFGRLAPRLAVFSMRHAGWVVGTATVLTLACVPLALSVKAESDVLAFFKPTHKVSVDTRLIESRLSGVTSLELLVTGNGPDSLLDVDKLRALRALQVWLEAQAEVDRSASFADMVEEMHFAMHGEAAGFRAIPPSNKLLRQYMLVYDGRDLFDLVSRDFSTARLLLSLNVHGANAITDAVQKIQRHLAANPIAGLTIEVGGEGRLFADQSNLLISGQSSSFLSAFGQIFIFMAILWRSVAAAGICLVPNLAPLYFVFVLMGALSIYLDTATVMIAGIVLGITVDDTIHLFHGYRLRRERGASPAWAIARCFEATGPAVMAISVLLISQFGLLAFSAFIPTSNFGLMTAVGLFSGQVFELLLTPALLVLAERLATWRAKRRSSRVRV